MKNELKVIADNGKAIDWWFMYKLPDNVKPKKGSDKKYEKSTGLEYMYFEAEAGARKNKLAQSKFSLDAKDNCLNQTLQQLYGATDASKDSLGWICYNDEIPDAESNDGANGHTKGVLAFDLESDTAFWLLHSWPKFPNIEKPAMASLNYGQTFLCVQLENVEAARYIAEQMYHRQEPQTYQNRIPKSLGEDDILYKVANAIDVNETDPPCDIHFLSKGQQLFRLMAKNRHWGKDFWIDLVGPHLQTNIDVETWRRGTLPGTEDANEENTATDILYIDLEKCGIPYEWHYTKDHSKWGVSQDGDWVCVADINRQTSQEKRGGGSICFQNQELHDALKSIEKLSE